MKASKEELVILDGIKKELISKSTFIKAPFIDGEKEYLIHITVEDWHNLFKTEEYNVRFRRT